MSSGALIDFTQTTTDSFVPVFLRISRNGHPVLETPYLLPCGSVQAIESHIAAVVATRIGIGSITNLTVLWDKPYGTDSTGPATSPAGGVVPRVTTLTDPNLHATLALLQVRQGRDILQGEQAVMGSGTAKKSSAIAIKDPGDIKKEKHREDYRRKASGDPSNPSNQLGKGDAQSQGSPSRERSLIDDLDDSTASLKLGYVAEAVAKPATGLGHRAGGRVDVLGHSVRDNLGSSHRDDVELPRTPTKKGDRLNTR